MSLLFSSFSLSLPDAIRKTLFVSVTYTPISILSFLPSSSLTVHLLALSLPFYSYSWSMNCQRVRTSAPLTLGFDRRMERESEDCEKKVIKSVLSSFLLLLWFHSIAFHFHPPPPFTLLFTSSPLTPFTIFCLTACYCWTFRLSLLLFFLFPSLTSHL